MPSSLQKARFVTAIASAAYTTTTTSAAFAMPGAANADTFVLIFRHTAATGTSPTMDAVVQSSVDGGTTYVNLPLRTTQVTAAGQNYIVWKMGLGESDAALESPAADTGGTLAKNCLFDPAFMKVKFTIGGTNPSITTVVYAATLNKGSR